jgi:hypothetical protein
MPKAIKSAGKSRWGSANRCRKPNRKLGFAARAKKSHFVGNQDEVLLGEVPLTVFIGEPMIEAMEADDAKKLSGLLQIAKAFGFDPFELEFMIGNEDGSASTCDLLWASMRGGCSACLNAALAYLCSESEAAQREHPTLKGFFAMLAIHFDSVAVDAGRLATLEALFRMYFAARKRFGGMNEEFIAALPEGLKCIALAMASEDEPLQAEVNFAVHTPHQDEHSAMNPVYATTLNV